MTEKEYLEILNRELKWLPPQEKEICFNYAREMIEDRIESGLDEAEAVAQLETPQAMAKAFKTDRDTLKLNFLPSSNSVLTIVLLVLGFPLWGTLVLAGLTVLLAGLLVLMAGFLIAGCVPFICIVMTISLLLIALISITASPAVMFSVSAAVGSLQLGLGLSALGFMILFAFGALTTVPMFKALLIKSKDLLVLISQKLRHLLFQEVKKW